jgi:beta-galactosidase
MRNKFNHLPFYQNPTLLGKNKEEAHTEAVSYLSYEDLDLNKETTQRSLNGLWKFKLYEHPKAVSDFYTLENTESSGWEDIQVPGVWELQGHGTPYYLAKSYPPQIETRKRKLPHISESDNPSGAYVTSFDCPSEFLTQRVFLRFGAVKSAFKLWVNGIEIGLSKASMTSHEFEIGAYLKETNNKLAVLVHKYSDGTYLEDQDMWFFGGITRDVILFSEPQTFIYDVFASCELINDYTDAQLKLEIKIKGELPKGLRLRVQLCALETQDLFDESIDRSSFTLTKLIKDPIKWTAETPNLYTLKFFLKLDENLIQAKKIRFGFRSVEIKACQFLINGKSIKFKGVNRHDFDPQLAWGIRKETRLKDLLIMKAHNINSIRASHYPNDPHLYDLADELGLYVIDEADLESHGLREVLPKDNELWVPAMIDRGLRMVLRDRNHPCIVMWSLGNEAGEGSSFMAMKEAMMACDSTRPFHYEGDKQKGLSDVYSMMYPSPELEARFGNKQDILPQGFVEKVTELFLSRKPVKKEAYADLPVMNCEYAHCMENSLGNFKEHIDNFEKYDNWIGGFIWDFVDQAIQSNQDDGSKHWLYGGDFDEDKTDVFFCANGLIAADRSLHPAISEVKNVYSNTSITDYDSYDHSILITNKNVFIDTSSMVFIARILENGIMIDQQLLKVEPIKAHTSERVFLKHLHTIDIKQEIICEVSALEKEDHPWAKAGHEICFAQFLINPLTRTLPVSSTSEKIVITQNRSKVLLSSSVFSVYFNKTTGTIDLLDYGKGKLLKAPLTFNFTRADLDNDCGIEIFMPFMKHFNAIRSWEKAQAKLKVKKVSLSHCENGIKLLVDYKMPNVKSLQATYTFLCDGTIHVLSSVLPKKDMIRFGMNLGLEPDFHSIEFYGKGPQENYRDRHHGSKIALHQGSITDFTHNYMRPQENGNHTEVRRLKISGKTSIIAFESSSETLLETSVWPYTQDDLKVAQHIHELPKHMITSVNIDYGQKGVAGDLPGFYAGPKEYHLPKHKTYTYGFSLKVSSL